ncbi:MAG: bifunctional DNA-formamidopyrimidine glycosylase/DNA-(apurinic or apyrimidinic site) lyase [Anaerolineae bacterium]
MPELPEVEVIAQGLHEQLAGQCITEVSVRWPRSIARPPAGELSSQLVGRTVQRVWRRGKFIVLDLAPSKHLIVHLRMTGQFLVCKGAKAPEADAHTHVSITFASGCLLHFRDVRKFGRFALVDDPAEVLGNLGPEPLSDAFTAEALAAILRGRRRQIKPALLDQTVVAGLGNIYVDEALWEARIHPLRSAHSLTTDQVARLYQAIRFVLAQAIANRGTTFRDYRDAQNLPGANQRALAVYGRKGEPCTRCATPIVRIVVGQRGTHLCPVCQALESIAQP